MFCLHDLQLISPDRTAGEGNCMVNTAHVMEQSGEPVPPPVRAPILERFSSSFPLARLCRPENEEPQVVERLSYHLHGPNVSQITPTSQLATKPTGIRITKRKGGRIGIGAIDLEGSQ